VEVAGQETFSSSRVHDRSRRLVKRRLYRCGAGDVVRVFFFFVVCRLSFCRWQPKERGKSAVGICVFHYSRPVLLRCFLHHWEVLRRSAQPETLFHSNAARSCLSCYVWLRRIGSRSGDCVVGPAVGNRVSDRDDGNVVVEPDESNKERSKNDNHGSVTGLNELKLVVSGVWRRDKDHVRGLNRREKKD
jgi:hypothetical protein